MAQNYFGKTDSRGSTPVTYNFTPLSSAEPFVTTKPYTVGEYCFYEGVLYRCKTDKAAGAWAPTKFEAAVIADNLEAVEGAIVTKAEIDGYYENLGAGTAEQLVSTIFEEDSTPYTFRTSGGSIDIGDRLYDEIVGGTVAWNQLVSNVRNGSGGTIVVDGDVTTISAFTARYPCINSNTFHTVVGHKYLAWADVKYTGTITENIWIYLNNRATQWGHKAIGSSDSQNTWIRTTEIYAPNVAETDNSFIKFQYNGADYENLTSISVKNTVCIDLTAMFGSAIADYIYSLEQATAGAGVAWFKKLFPKPYYAYNAGELMHVSGVSSHDMVGFNAWDEEWELGYYNVTTGEPATSSSNLRGKNFVPVVPNTSYYAKIPTGYIAICEYDADKNFIKCTQGVANSGITTTADTHFIRFHCTSAYGTTYQNDICINLSWDGERDGEYEPYVKHSYPLDSSLELRGIPKLDASNNLYYDGDTYESDGTVTRKYEMREITSADGIATASLRLPVRVNLNPQIYGLDVTAIICDKCVVNNSSEGDTTYENQITCRGTYASAGAGAYMWFFFPLSIASTLEEANTWLATNKPHIVYRVATPTTETADPYTNPQIVDDFGTEEYVTTSIVPVGHNTKYQPNLRAKLEMAPNSPDGNGEYIVTQANGENSYTPLASSDVIQGLIARIEALEGAEGGGE